MEKIILLHAVSFLLNTWFGYLRRDKRKLSFLWFLYIHASIPFIVPLRIFWHVSAWYIPSLILCAVAGQLAGSHPVPNLFKRPKNS